MTDWPWLSMLIVSVAYLAMFAAGELLHRRRFASADQTRKLSHVAAGGIALTLPAIFASPGPVIFVVVAFIAFLLATKATGLLASVHAIRRRSLGAFMYPVAIAATFVLAADAYPRYAIAILALAVGDAMGGIVGDRWGRHPFAAWGQRKTWDGSAAVVVTLSVISGVVLVLGGAALPEAAAKGVIVGLVAGLVEGALPYGLDNLGVPLAALAALEAGGSATGAAAVLVGAATLFTAGLAASRLASRRSAAGADPARAAAHAR